MPRKPSSATRCQHHTKDHKRCHMPAAPPVAQTSVCVPSQPTLCPHHQRTAVNQIYQSAESSRREKDPVEIAAVATQLLAGTSDLSTPASVNLFLGNLLTQLAHNKISRRNAIAMAYISQLLLNSISVKHRQDRDAQAAQLQAEANAPQRIVIDMPRPLHHKPVDDDPNGNYPNDNPGRCSGGSSVHPDEGRDPFFSPSLRSGESSDSHSVGVAGSGVSDDAAIAPAKPFLEPKPRKNTYGPPRMALAPHPVALCANFHTALNRRAAVKGRHEAHPPGSNPPLGSHRNSRYRRSADRSRCKMSAGRADRRHHRHVRENDSPRPLSLARRSEQPRNSRLDRHRTSLHHRGAGENSRTRRAHQAL
jgi:hypothetical protein